MAKAINVMLDRITTLVSTEEERDMMQKRLTQFLMLVSDVGRGDLHHDRETNLFGKLDGFALSFGKHGACDLEAVSCENFLGFDFGQSIAAVSASLSNYFESPFPADGGTR